MPDQKNPGDTATGPTPALVSTSSSSSSSMPAASSPPTFGHTPLAGRAHIVNRGSLQDEASAGPGSLDPKTLAPPKIPEARRWLAKRGVELSVPANWKYLGVGNDGRSMTFVSDTDAAAHGIEIYVSPIPDDVSGEVLLASQEEQLQEAVELKRVTSFSRKTLGQVPGLLVVGWGPESRDALATVSDEDLYLGTDGTGRRAVSWRGIVTRDGERALLMVALSSPIESFPDARPCYDAILDHLGVWG
jgi:hypothetical protein